MGKWTVLEELRITAVTVDSESSLKTTWPIMKPKYWNVRKMKQGTETRKEKASPV